MKITIDMIRTDIAHAYAGGMFGDKYINSVEINSIIYGICDMLKKIDLQNNAHANGLFMRYFSHVAGLVLHDYVGNKISLNGLRKSAYDYTIEHFGDAGLS